VNEMCQRCQKRVPQRREFMLAMLEARKLSLLRDQYRAWWRFIDGVCTCPERNFPVDMVRVLNPLRRAAQS
jgi:hypothetical protein